eukprot:TRINITY_DN18520_c0_g1::TRINITY_DN18520_c0_g1_i1::g.2769::m.2769 TRINITY_DN18520_c0_g1::TRINITY_DN18520_c0_g1_i1::g.2769  ORF type:complete len:543 (+),score=112.48,sp/P13723/HEXA1_DICDI/38.95/2e-130,Glyco_hydro_20/PF00728.17/4.5e-93,Glycohydro_20b2/PF14845.1/1.2e-23,Glyco_hydro_20b/PF02838.10/0.00016 TRINITY_DN18520_c0_g1_i1:60-1631(+)
MHHTTLIVVFFACFVCISQAVTSVWPAPTEMKLGSDELVVAPGSFAFKTMQNSDILQQAFNRYYDLIFNTIPKDVDHSGKTNFLREVEVIVSNPSVDLDQNTNEEYHLSIEVNPARATLKAETVFGALRGLETFSQLVGPQLAIESAPLIVHDKPRFSWRGLLVDTSRHFLSMDLLKRTIDALAFNKMNVMHWHILDAQSFPLEIESFPDLTIKGSYDYPVAVYTKSDIREIVEYGRYRGVRVVMELDMPGHAHAWGVGYPELTVDCPSYEWYLDNIPLDISKEFTYEVVQNVIEETAEQLDDLYMHIGGDEVVFGCWTENKEVNAWLEKEGITPAEAENYFIARAIDYVRDTGKRAVVWQEVFDHNATLGLDTIIQVWLHRESLRTALQVGHQALLSQGWYLDVLKPGGDHYRFQDTWKDFYINEPHQSIEDLNNDLKSQLLGGEGCMWGEQVDDSNFESRVWPRASAIGERLWSPREVNDVDSATPRLAAFRCHLWRRGIRAGPLTWPDYCPTRFSPRTTV